MSGRGLIAAAIGVRLARSTLNPAFECSMTTHKNFINGEWIDGAETVANVNPSDLDDTIGDYAQANAHQTEAAIAAAKAAFPAWSRTIPQQRADALDAIGAEILARREELGKLLSREEGKPLADGIAEATRAGQIFRFYAGEALRRDGIAIDSIRPGVEVTITRDPIGVVGLITPWNFPIAIPAWKLAPALAYGNTAVLKPASLVPGSAWALVEIASRCGLPPGVVNLVMGRGSAVGHTILNSSAVNGVSFTGSVQTGAQIAQACAKQGIKFQLEMGGKNPLVILDDANLELSVAAAVNGAFYQTGQRCTASSRLIVTENIHDAFVERMVAVMKGLVVDHALKPGTQIGPVVDENQLKQDLDYIKIGKEEGAELAWGASLLNRNTRGHYLRPALFVDTNNGMRINREEIFGPVATVIKARDYDEALAIANDTPFGLSSGICTRSLKHAADFRRNSTAGMVMVNLPTAGVDYHVSFGGRKGSSAGSREQGRGAIEFFTTTRTHYVLADS
jgi:alpha-ketoglutaric semialdehyde dehydrogenase